jgi:hypothetical protein
MVARNSIYHLGYQQLMCSTRPAQVFVALAAAKLAALLPASPLLITDPGGEFTR